MAIMDALAEGRSGPESLSLMEEGTLPEGAYVTGRFQQRVTDTVNRMLRRSIRRFEQRFSEALSERGTDTVQLLLARLHKELALCFFFRRMPFLDECFRNELETALLGEIRKFWRHEIREIRRLAELPGHAELEEVMYSMKRFAKEYGE